MLYVHQGRQTSSSFNDHVEALRFQDVCNRLGPAEALKVWKASTPRRGHTLKSYVTEHLGQLRAIPYHCVIFVTSQSLIVRRELGF